MNSQVKAALVAAAALSAFLPQAGRADGFSAANPAATRWIDGLERRLDRALSQDGASAAEAGSGAAEVGFRIAPDGAVRDLRIERSSGSKALDAATLETVQALAPLPAPPAWVQARRVVIRTRYEAPRALGRADDRPLAAVSSGLRAAEPRTWTVVSR